MPLLIIISASIGGVLLSIVILVVGVTWRKVSKAKSDHSKNSWPKSANQMQADRVSNSSNDSNLHSSNTTSSMSTMEDMEGCSDILHEFQGANHFTTRSPGSGSEDSVKNNRNYSNHNNYSDYRQFRSEHDLLDHAAKYSSDYHNPYLQTITPTSDYNSSGHMSPSYRNFAPVSVSSMSSPRRDDGRYSSGMEQEKTLLNRLQQGHLPSYLQDHHQGHHTPQLGEQLNQSSIGTHV